MMKVCAIILVISCTILQGFSQNHRGKYPIRGPPRPPPYPAFVKKWQQLQMTNLRGPLPQGRPRPLPVHYNPHKYMKPFPPKQMNIPNRLAQAAQSARPYWPNPQTTYRSPTEKPVFIKPTEKYVFGPPSHHHYPQVQNDYDFHIQTNQIPLGMSSTQNNPIQQVGEKGPIHTIPAPNLSPADKPNNIEHVRQQPQHVSFQPQQNFRNEYHVTESNDQAKHLNNYFNSDNEENVHAQNTQNVQYKAQPFREMEQQDPFGAKITNTPPHQNPAQFYQIVQNIQQGPSESEEIPHQQFLQSIPNFHMLISDEQDKRLEQQNPTNQQILVAEASQQNEQQNLYHQQSAPVFLTDLSYVQKFQQDQTQIPSEHININPEFHSFNYNEQDYQNQNYKSQLKSPDFDTEHEGSDFIQRAMARNSGEAVAESKFVQNFFDTKDGNLANNNVEPDIKIKEELLNEDDKVQSSSGFYSSLPNKEVADALASLQSAGKINSSLMQLTQLNPDNQEELKIFLPDNSNQNSEIKIYEVNDDSLRDYETSDEEDAAEILNTSFGDKIKPKRT